MIDQLLIPGPKKCVLSSEMLFFCETSESLETIAKIAKERFDRVTILCYLRRQDLLAVSHRNQVANGAAAASFYGSDPSPIPQFSPHLKRYYDYATKLNTVWVENFGKENVVVVPFERDRLEGGDVVHDFGKRIGVNTLDYKGGERNVSQSAERLLLKIALNEAGVAEDVRRVFVKFAAKDTPKMRPTKYQAKAFLDNFSDDNDRLAKEFTFEGQPFLFNPSMDMYPEQLNDDWNNERVINLIVSIASAVKRLERFGLQKP